MKETGRPTPERSSVGEKPQKFRKLKDWARSNVYSGAMFIGSAFTAGLASIGLFAAGVVTEIRSFNRLTKPEHKTAPQTAPQNLRPITA